MDGKYSALPFLREMQQILPDLAWSDHVFSSKGDGRARHAVSTGLPDEVKRLARIELEEHRDPLTLVDFVSARRVTPNRLRSVGSREAKSAAAESVKASHPAAVQLLDYMNGISKQPFTQIVRRNMDAAYTVARAIEDPNRQAVAYRLLREITVQPKPFYRPSKRDKTPRIFGSGMVRLPREVRAAITKGWDWFDLSSAQLAIAATQWGVGGELAPFLKNRKHDSAESIWDSLFAHLGSRAEQIMRQGGADYEAVKGVLKSQLYGVVFGQGKTGLARFETQEEKQSGDTSRADTISRLLGEPAEALGRRFLRHEAIKVLLSARSRVKSSVKEDGGIVDAFGVWIPAKTDAEIRSALAQVAQASEMKLLLPVIELASKRRILHVTLWLHDGFAVHVIDRQERSKVRDQIQRLVRDQARSHEMRTYAKADLAPGPPNLVAELRAKLEREAAST